MSGSILRSASVVEAAREMDPVRTWRAIDEESVRVWLVGDEQVTRDEVEVGVHSCLGISVWNASETLIEGHLRVHLYDVGEYLLGVVRLKKSI